MLLAQQTSLFETEGGKRLNVLVACEESQAVCKAFRALGHRAFSCDLQPCSGGHPEWHIVGDVLPLIDGRCKFTTSDTHTHTHKPRVGLADRSSAVHLSEQCRGLPNVPETGRNRPGAAKAGDGGQSVLSENLERRLRENLHREPFAALHRRPAGAASENPTVRLRGAVEQADVPLAEESAGADPDRVCRGAQALRLLRNQQKQGEQGEIRVFQSRGSAEGTEPDVSKNRRSFCGSVGW